MPGALFDPIIKVCKEVPTMLSPPSPPTQQKLVATRRRTQEEAIPITEEFIFSTRRPKRPRPTKGPLLTTTASPVSVPISHSTTFPSPPPLMPSRTTTAPPPITTTAPLPSSTPRMPSLTPYSPAFTPPTRKIATFATAPLVHPTLWPAAELTQGQQALGQQPLGQQTPFAYPDTSRAIPFSESHMTKAYPTNYAFTNQGPIHPQFTSEGVATVQQSISHQGNEQDFLHELLRLVKAHQIAIDGIKEENESSKRPVEILMGTRPEERNNFVEDQTAFLKHTNELQKRIERNSDRMKYCKRWRRGKREKDLNNNKEPDNPRRG
ncbi:hypothetical protein COOONC_06920 [Cooperia oncophora]